MIIKLRVGIYFIHYTKIINEHKRMNINKYRGVADFRSGTLF
jgi:hypothetical protein